MVYFKDIPQFTQDGHYQPNVSWDYLEDHLKRWLQEGLDMNPDFQRGHIWTEDQQIKFVEFSLRGGKSGRIIQFNCRGWMTSFEGPFVLVDGKQRLEAARRFLANEIPAFGYLLQEYEDPNFLRRIDFVLCVNDLKTRKEVLQWYIDLNTGGTIHTNEEIEKVKILLEKE